VRERDGRGETRTTSSAEELLEVLGGSFGIGFPGSASELDAILASLPPQPPRIA
jgi:hypothetical protein